MTAVNLVSLRLASATQCILRRFGTRIEKYVATAKAPETLRADSIARKSTMDQEQQWQKITIPYRHLKETSPVKALEAWIAKAGIK